MHLSFFALILIVFKNILFLFALIIEAIHNLLCYRTISLPFFITLQSFLLDPGDALTFTIILAIVSLHYI